MIYEFTLVLDREPSQVELETLAAAGLDPIGAEGPHPALVHLVQTDWVRWDRVASAQVVCR